MSGLCGPLAKVSDVTGDRAIGAPLHRPGNVGLPHVWSLRLPIDNTTADLQLDLRQDADHFVIGAVLILTPTASALGSKR